MKHLIAFATILLSVSACGGRSDGTVRSAAPHPAAVQTISTSSFGEILNAVRAQNGAPPVKRDNRLDKAAMRHANDMLRNGFFEHRGSDGSTVGTRARAAGFRWNAVAENIAMGQESAADAMWAWTHSPGHHRNNINPQYTSYGVAEIGNGAEKRWVLVLAREG